MTWQLWLCMDLNHHDFFFFNLVHLVQLVKCHNDKAVMQLTLLYLSEFFMGLGICPMYFLLL